MDDIQYVNTRFDPDLVDFHDIAKQMAKSVGYTADMSVDGQLAQLLRLRVAQINACSYCLILHTRAAHEQGIHEAKLAHLPSWRESTMFSAAEQAALAYCEGLTDYDLPGFPATARCDGRAFQRRRDCRDCSDCHQHEPVDPA